MGSLTKSFIIPGPLFLFLHNEKYGLDILEILYLYMMAFSFSELQRKRKRKGIGLKNKCVSHGLRLVGAGLHRQAL